MNRRRALAGLGGLVGVTLAGCLDAGSGGPSEGATDGDPSTPGGGAAPRLIDRSFAPTDGCAAGDAGSATVTYAQGTREEAVQCDGCIRGANGCTEAVPGSVGYDADAGVLSVVVATGNHAGGEAVCTQQVVYRGYTAVLTFTDGHPDETVVYHESLGERREAARASGP